MTSWLATPNQKEGLGCQYLRMTDAKDGTRTRAANMNIHASICGATDDRLKVQRPLVAIESYDVAFAPLVQIAGPRRDVYRSGYQQSRLGSALLGLMTAAAATASGH